MTSPQAEPSTQALGESLAALAAQVAALRGQVTQINGRVDHAGLRGELDLAARFEELAQTVAGALDARLASRSRRSPLDRPGPRRPSLAAGRAAGMGRYGAAPALSGL